MSMPVSRNRTSDQVESPLASNDDERAVNTEDSESPADPHRARRMATLLMELGRPDRDKAQAVPDTTNGKAIDKPAVSAKGVNKEDLAKVADLLPTVERFGRQVDAVERMDQRFPCVWLDGRVPHPTPLDLDAFLMTLGIHALLGDDGGGMKVSLLPRIAKAASSARLDVTQVHVDDVRHFFRSRLAKFIAARMQPRQPATSQGSVAADAGIEFSVHSPTPGTRVHVSTAYFFDPNRFFGAPTSPARGVLRPGTYVFGVAHGEQVLFDPAEFEVPELSEATLIY